MRERNSAGLRGKNPFAFPHGLIVVKRENMRFVFDYVIQTYGRDFTRLYE
jgi:hypothetical protein